MVDNAHPALEQLAAFASGELDDDNAAGIETHLNVCDTCWNLVQGQPETDLIRLLRSAALEAGQNTGKEQSTGLLGFVGAELDFEIPAELQDHPKYRVLGRIGTGGMGVVMKAHHQLMGKPVALKIVRPHLLRDGQTVERFRREMQAAAQLDHPNIAHARDAEELGDLLVLVLEYIEGDTLADIVKRQGPLPVDQACNYVQQAAAGLQHASDKGVVHRDIKPQNLMLTQQQVVKILDFGLARRVGDFDDSEAITSVETAMGTPDYIAPEQAENSHEADIRADIYSLGCSLYFLLVGRPPFPVRGTFQKIDAHRNKTPPPITERRKDVPAGLAAVLRKMMAKDPARRFQTPAEVVEALAPFLAEPSVPAMPREKRSSRRKIFVAVSSIVALFFILIAYQFGPVVYRIVTNQGELVIESDDPDVEVIIRREGQQVRILDLKTKQRITLQAGQYELFLNHGKERLKLSTPTFSLSRGGREIVRVSYTSALSTTPGPTTPRPVVAAPTTPTPIVAASGEAIGEVLCLKGHTAPVNAVGFSPDGRHVVSGAQDNTIRLWDLLTRKEIRQFTGSEHWVLTVAFSSDGRLIVSGGEDQMIRVWETTTGRQVGILRGHTHKIWRAVFSPDNSTILSASEDGTIRLWDVHAGHQIGCVAEHQGVVTTVAFCPDGRYALSGSLNGSVRLWDVKLRKQIRDFVEGPDQIWSVAVSSDGKHALSGGYFPSVLRLWNVEQGTELAQSQVHPHWIRCVTFSTDGRRALSSTHQNTIHLWDCEDWHEILSLSGHAEPVWSVAFSPDGSYAISGSWDHTVRLWKLPTSEAELNTLRRELAPLEGLVVSYKGIIIRTSYYDPGESPTALYDGILPKSSDDMEVPRMTWAGRRGSQQWVSYLFPEPRQISKVKVYWYDDTPRGLSCRVPKQWRLLWRTENDDWEPVSLVDSEYTTALHQFNEVNFAPVTTRELKIEVSLHPFYAGGVLEWTVSSPSDSSNK